MDLRSGECNVVSLYVLCCSVNESVCCVFDSVCELFGEIISICLSVFVILLLNVMEVFYCMYVVVNVVVSDECDEPTSCLVEPIVAHCCEVMYFGCFDFGGEFSFLNCDDICMCVVNKPFELLEFGFESVNVDLQYVEISLTFTAGSVCFCGVCSPWSVCEVAVVPYSVGAVVAVTVMHVLLYVLHVCMLRECEVARVTAMLVWGPGQGLAGGVVLCLCVV